MQIRATQNLQSHLATALIVQVSISISHCADNQGEGAWTHCGAQ